MSSSQKRAIQNYRSRLSERGLARFEVLGRDGDRDLIRSLARRLAEDTPEASALRRSLVAGVDLARGSEESRNAPRKRIDAILLRALTASMPPQAENAADLVRSMRDGDRA
jgi:hypothetical protein